MSSIPPFADLVFSFQGFEIARFPCMIFTTFIVAKGGNPDKDQALQCLCNWADSIGKPPFMDGPRLINYLQSKLSWDEIKPYIVLNKDSECAFSQMWIGKDNTARGYEFSLESLKCPRLLYRYVSFSQERLERIFCKREIHFQSHAFFNDPFDSNFDSAGHYATLDWGMLCMSELQDHVLMYSHYADSHKGLCLGIDTDLLHKGLSALGVHPYLRPVFYCAQKPKIDFKKHPALYTTCKDRIWAYEKEYRLILANSTNKPLPFGNYAFDPSAITSITFGCRASDETIAITRRIASVSAHKIDYYLAKQTPDQFGITCEPYPTH